MTTPNQLNKKVQELWRKYLPQTLARLEVLQSAVETLSRGDLTTEARTAAAQEAHKLAGSLGTFGLESGSGIAVEIEQTLSSHTDFSDTEISKLKVLGDRLQQEIESR